MADIKFVELKCQRCGGGLEENGGTYVCASCGKKWLKETMHDFTDMLEACEQAIQSQRIADIANLRQLLWKETHNEYVSNIKVSEYCTDILKYLPNDFYAEFYLATCGKSKTALGVFLTNVNIENHTDDIALVLDYLLKSLKPEWVMGVSNFIEKIKDVDMPLYHKYRTRFENEYQNIEDGVFEADLERDVFIAYSSADMPEVMKLVAALEEEGLLCFVAARNMRHGSGSVENYRELLHAAINNCRVFVFVSSGNSRSFSCDAYKEEIKYIGEHRKNMPRVEYLIQNYCGKAVERNFKTFFSGLEYCVSVQDVVERVADIIMNQDSEPDSQQEDIERKNKELQQQIEEERRKAKELEAKIAQAERRQREQAEANAKAEEDRKRREEAEARARAEAAQRAEQERQRKLREEEERKEQERIAEEKRKAEAAQRAEQERLQREQFEARAKAQAERQRKLQEEQERKLREEEERKHKEEARKALLNIGEYKDIGGGYITFGAYPQSKKASNVKIGAVIDKECGYYLGSDNSIYEKYNNEYYKVEPIKWKVLSRGSELFIASDIILDAHRFDKESNNYANSEIRKWLNGEFYNKAFKQEQKNKIVTTNVDNGLASTGDSSNQYVCGNTNDKVFLLSHKEAEQYFNNGSARQKMCTDYAKASNLYFASSGNSYWWLRSPYNNYSNYAQRVNVDGIGDFYSCDVRNDFSGVVCALKIKSQANGLSGICESIEDIDVAEEKAKAEVETKAREEEERRRKTEAERQRKIKEEERKRKEEEAEAEEKAKAEAEVKAWAEAERKRKAEAAAKAKAEAERKAKIASDFEIKDGTLVKYKGKGGDVVIPDGYVKRIGEYAFSNCKSLTNIIIPNSVTAIAKDAFYMCGSITNVTIPDSVVNIGEGAFGNCYSLASVKIPKSVIFIGDLAFTGCYGLMNINVSPENIKYKSIDGNLYNRDGKILIQYAVAKKASSFSIPEGVTTIGKWAFSHCKTLTSITIPDGVTTIGGSAFSCCESLTSITIPNRVISIGARAFSYCHKLTRINLPNRVKTIGEGTFSGCELLSSIIIPGSVTSIGDEAFESCKNLKSIIIPNSVTTIGEWAFHSCESLTRIIIPDSVTSIGDEAFGNCENLTSIIISKGVLSMGENVFSNCDNLKTIYCRVKKPLFGNLPKGWNENWLGDEDDKCPAKVVWNYKEYK